MFGQKLYGLSFAFALMSFMASFCAAESLSDSLRNAYQNSGLLAQNRALLRAADEGEAGSVAALRPIIKWSSTFQKFTWSSKLVPFRSKKIQPSHGNKKKPVGTNYKPRHQETKCSLHSTAKNTKTQKQDG